MPLHDLVLALEDDHALFFDDEDVLIPFKGWVWKYANSMIVYIDDQMIVYRESNIPIEPEDQRDLEIIGRMAGYTVEITDISIIFTVI